VSPIIEKRGIGIKSHAGLHLEAEGILPLKSACL